MSATLQHISGELLNLHPNVSSWILDAARTTAIALGTFGMASLLAHRSAVARSWVIRMGFVTLAIAAVWQVVPSAYTGFRPSMRFDVVIPTPAQSVPPTKDAQFPEVMRDLPRPDPLANESIPLASSVPSKTSEPETADSQHSAVTWFEEKLGLVWIGGTLLIAGWLLLRHFTGLMWLHRNGRLPNQPISKLVMEMATSLRIGRTPECRIVKQLSNPLMTGWRQAWIWLPEETMEMPVMHQQAIIAHEVAHFRRNDLPWQTCATLISAFWWWNPLAWLLLKRLKSEAELATDEFVVSGNAIATDYAEALVKVAAGIHSSPQRHIGVPMAGKSSVEQRVKAILADNPFRNRLGWIASIAVVALTLMGCFVASISAIAQEKKSPSAAETSPQDTQQQLAERIPSVLNADSSGSTSSSVSLYDDDLAILSNVIENNIKQFQAVSVRYDCVVTEDIGAQKNERVKALERLEASERRDEKLIKDLRDTESLPNPLIKTTEGRFSAYLDVERRLDSLFDEDARRQWLREYPGDGRVLVKQVIPNIASSAMIMSADERLAPAHVLDIFKVPLVSVFQNYHKSITWPEILKTCKVDNVVKEDRYSIYILKPLPGGGKPIQIDGLFYNNYRVNFKVSDLGGTPVISGYEILVGEGEDFRKASQVDYTHVMSGVRVVPEKVTFTEFWPKVDAFVRRYEIKFSDWKFDDAALKQMFAKKVIQKGDKVYDAILDIRYEVK